MLKDNLYKIIVLLPILLITSCFEEVVIFEGLPDWTTESHSGNAIPNYDIVFNQNEVNRLDIVIAANAWDSMQVDLVDYINANGINPLRNPIYVESQVYFQGKQWYHVGIRYRGKSSLTKTYEDGIRKLPFRLSFDHFEDKYDEINDQAFYGFEVLSLNNSYKDESFIKEKMASTIFAAMNVPTTSVAHYEIYIDYGDGPIYFGLYSALEVVERTTLLREFGSNNGNCYKPEGESADWALSGFNPISFDKRNNEDVGDWSDIESMFEQLHHTDRISNPNQWQSDLSAQFDVDGFLKYLAVNTTIQNWDTYGRKARNYYLYHDPQDDLIKWIPWDYNEAFEFGDDDGALSFSFSEITTSDWPLIKFLIDVPIYKEGYDIYIENLINGTFDPTNMEAMYLKEKNLIEASVVKEEAPYTLLNGTGEFNLAISALITQCSQRKVAAENYLN